MLGIISYLWRFIWVHILWRLYKIVAHKLTGKSRIERLCTTIQLSGKLTRSVELEILASKSLSSVHESLSSLRPFDVEQATRAVVNSKGFGSSAEAVAVLKGCLQAMSDYNAVIEELRELKQPYSKANPQHEAALEDLWQQLRPGVRRNGGRITKEWQEIGFQGADPATDMRGMGFLGLAQLVNFANEHHDAALEVYGDSVTHGYPMAIAGINFSLNVYDWVLTRKAAGLLYSARGGPSLWAVDSLYCQLFVIFNKEWVRERPPNMLAFERIRAQVTERCARRLEQEAGEPLHSFESKTSKRPSRLMGDFAAASGPASPASPSNVL